MRKLLQELDIKLDEAELDLLIRMLSGAQAQRLDSGATSIKRATRTSAIAAIAELDPDVFNKFAEAGLDWESFRQSIGLTRTISPDFVRDVDLDINLERALRRFAREKPPRPLTPATLTSSIVRMLVEAPEQGKLGRRLSDFGVDIQSLQRLFEESPSPKQKSPTPETDRAGNTDDRLLEELLTRKLAASAVGSKDVDDAHNLIRGPEEWGLGPVIEAGDILIVYFPKGLADRLPERGKQPYGLRFLLRAASESTATGNSNVKQSVKISDTITLSKPVRASSFTTPPLSDWGPPKTHFRNVGSLKEPLAPEIARALWTQILETNPKIRPLLERWVEEAPKQRPAPDPKHDPDPKPKPKSQPEPKPDPDPEPMVSTHATNDLWTVDDKLGYAKYARAIFNFLIDPRTEPPLTISIQAPWGGGKTSLMKMVQKEIDPKGYDESIGGTDPSLSETLQATTKDLLDELRSYSNREPTPISFDLGKGKYASIWFNAWRYQSSDQIWAGMAEAIIRGITDRLNPVDREKFLLRLHLSRINPDRIRSKFYDAVFLRAFEFIRRNGWLILGLVAGPILLGSLFGGVQLALPATFFGTFGATLLAYEKAKGQTEAEPAQITLSDYMDVPDYSEKLGFLHHVTEDLRRVFELLPKDKNDKTRRVPLVIFIDDLDRCTPQNVAGVFEAINLFIAGEFPNCYVIIGMDSEVVAAALEEAHKNVIKGLPGNQRRAPVGWRFMDKFVQLPFVIPPLDADADAVTNYADYLSAAEDIDVRQVQESIAGGKSDAVSELIQTLLENEVDDEEIINQVAEQIVGAEKVEQHDKAAIEAKRIVKVALKDVKTFRLMSDGARELHSDTEKIRTLLIDSKQYFSSNPRELKRLVNVYRFYYNLRLVRSAQALPVPSDAQLRNWLILSLAWPQVVRWLRRGASEWEPEDDAQKDHNTTVGNRLLKIEEFAGEASTIEGWTKKLQVEFGLPKEVAWATDERLLGFMRNVVTAGRDGLLSGGAGKGFW